jgi:predicted Zn-dependent peptidase
MVFKGSSRRPSARAIAEAVDNIGGEFNAGTSKEWTNFYIRTRSGNLDIAFDVLSDMVLNPILKEDDIEREKGVILEEISLYEDTPTARIGDIFEQTIFEGSSLGQDIIGTRESVKSLKRNDFKKHIKSHYHPKNMLITVSGGVKKEETLALVEKYFGGMNAGLEAEHSKKFVATQSKPRLTLKNQPKEQAHFIIGFLGNKRGANTRFAEGLLATILGGGMSSRLFTEIREKRGLGYSVRANVEHFVDTGYFESYAGVELGKIDEAIKVILDQFYGLVDLKYKISQEELVKAKEYLKGHLALSLEDTRNINHFFGEEELLAGKVLTPDEVFSAVDKVGIDEIVSVAKEIFIPKMANLAIIGPYDKEERFKKLLQ